MAEKTGIEWTDSTWNPVTGCTRVSPGCAHCYIETTFPFRNEGRIFDRVGDEETTGVRLHPERLERVPKGPRVFVCSLADLFHEDVPDDYVEAVWQTMAHHRDRTFQVLTKRPERARDLLTKLYDRSDEARLAGAAGASWDPLSNIWLGVSIENARYTWRADVLREIPAAVRFISAEPLLGSLFEDESRTQRRRRRECSAEVVRGFIEEGAEPDDASCYVRAVEAKLVSRHKRPLDLTEIDWLIAGGESGGRFARPMHPAWARELRDACRESCPTADLPLVHPETGEPAGVAEDFPVGLPRTAFFFKQWGSWVPAVDGAFVQDHDSRWVWPDGRSIQSPGPMIDAPNGLRMRYAGASSKSGGKLLDGREWCEFPRSAEAVPA